MLFLFIESIILEREARYAGMPADSKFSMKQANNTPVRTGIDINASKGIVLSAFMSNSQLLSHMTTM